MGDDLRIAGTALYLDSRQPRPLFRLPRPLRSHRPARDCDRHPATAALAEHRIGLTGVKTVDYRTDLTLDDDGVARLLPAGHLFGSAMLHLTRPEGTLLYTGDFKLRESLTVEKGRADAGGASRCDGEHVRPRISGFRCGGTLRRSCVN
jgi:Cft2 family RNA processing exonuclease